MGLKKDYSVVADSEMAASPRSFMSSPPPIRRAARTYGRRREDPDSSFTYSEQDSRDSIYRTGPPDMSDEVPPSESSKQLDSDDEDEGDGDVLPSSPGRPWNTFGWRDRLKEIDNEDDLSGYLSPQDTSEHVPSKEVVLSIPGHVDTGVDSPVKSTDARTSTAVISEDVFGGSISTLTSPSQPTTLRSHSILDNASTASRNRLRTQKNLITSDDDMDHDDKGNSRPSSPQTSSPRLIVTPDSQLTSSPPTSHHDDVSANSAPSSTSKGKGKASKARKSVAPLRFGSHQPEDLDRMENIARLRATLAPRGKKRKIKVTYCLRLLADYLIML